jgi:hypothetical protein
VPRGPTAGLRGTPICALRTDDKIVQGVNTYGRLRPAGLLPSSMRATPGCHAIDLRHHTNAGRQLYGEGDVPEDTYLDMASGTFHVCAITKDETAICWGSNSKGQLDIP